MKSLLLQAVVQSIAGTAFFIVIIFGAAGTWDYWQGWAFIGVFVALTLGFTLYMLRYDRGLLERRMNAGPWKEKESSQKIIVSLIMLSFFGFIVLSILDHRYGFSPVSSGASVLGDVVVALSFLFVFWVVHVNSWAASNIAVAEGQTVISSGPYAYVRHPMYAAMFPLFLAMPLAFGSWWTMCLIVLFIPVVLWRLLDEERVLRRDLPGYAEYIEKVRYRLIPYIY